MSPALPQLIRRPIIATGSIVVVFGVAVELVHAFDHSPFVETSVRLFSLSYEKNVPTWWATCLLFSAGLLLASIAAHQQAGSALRGRWWLLAAGFFYISLDEAIEIHENLGGLFSGKGIFYFDWVIPASIVVMALGFVYWPFLMALHARRRRQFIIAGGLFVGGALLMELPLGWWVEQHGDDNLTYALIDFVEEALELAGVSLFVLSLAEHHSELVT
jgi:hypothetical protein